jgi:hypothetical protein
VFSNWTKICERIRKIRYKPSLFKELVNEINKTKTNSIITTTVHPRSHEEKHRTGAREGEKLLCVFA